MNRSSLAIDRSHDFICVVASVVASACIALMFTLAWPDSARSTANPEPVVSVDFDQVFAIVNPVPTLEELPLQVTKVGPARVTIVDFNQVFASIAGQRANTPQNREKLRNAGWRRIL